MEFGVDREKYVLDIAILSGICYSREVQIG